MKEFLNFKGHEKDVNAICWHPQIEELFCSAGADGYLIFWNAMQENKNYIIKDAHKKDKESDKKEIFDIAYNTLGNILVSTGNDNTIKVWQANPEIN
jgi:WD40 repeat protein